MNKLRLLLPLLMLMTLAPKAHAIYTELGVNYSERLTMFDANNSVKSKSTTASLSLYFWETLGVELSYTNATNAREESYTSNNLTVHSTITQYQTITGADLIFSLANRKSMIQPYIKGGAAYIQKRQVNVDDYGQSELVLAPGTVPSYGVGLKFMVSEAFAIKTSYDSWQTPNSDTKVSDNAIRVGLQWIF